MKTNKLITATTALSAAALLITPRMMAQDSSPSPTPAASASASASASPATGGSSGTHEDFRQRMNDRIKTALKASDDEWAVIQPLLEKVQTLQRESLMGRFGGLMGGFGGRRGREGGDQAGSSPSPNGGNNNRPDRGGDRGGSPESQALKAALDSDSTSVDDIKAKLQALRDSRKKATADLEAAREDLKKVLTLRQEATLVMMGMLD